MSWREQPLDVFLIWQARAGRLRDQLASAAKEEASVIP